MARSSLHNVFQALMVISVATTTHSYLIERALSIPSKLPGSWKSLGCYTDIGRTLSGGGYVDQANMTGNSCINYCMSKGFIYAGTEFSDECYCGMDIASTASQAPASDCASACVGNSTQPCGGASRLNMFWSNTTGPQINPGNDSWAFAGCYTEGNTGRTLPNGVDTVGGSENMTVGTCTTACRKNGYNLAGVEYGGECWCSSSIMNGGTLAPEGVSGCSQLCNGNLSEFCGGYGRLGVYDFNRTVTLPAYTTVSTTSKVSSTSRSSSSSSFTPTTSKKTTISSSSLSSSKLVSSSSTTSTSKTSSSSRYISSSSSSKSLSSTSSLRLSSSNSISSSRSTSTSKPSFSSTSAKSSLALSSTSSLGSSSSKPTSSSHSTSTSKSSSSSKHSSSSSSTSKSSTASSSIHSSSSSTSKRSTASSSIHSSSSRSLTTSKSSTLTTAISTPTSTKLSSSSSKSSSSLTGSKASGSLTSTTRKSSTISSSLTTSKSSTNTSGTRSSVSSITSSKTGSSSFSTHSSTQTTKTSSSSSSSSSTTSNAKPSKTALDVVQYIGQYKYIGCYTEATNVRTFSDAAFPADAMTLELCSQSCKGYKYWGVEYGRECYCGNSIGAGALIAPESDCSFTCPSDQFEYCGAGSRLTAYQLNSTISTGSSSSITTSKSAGVGTATNVISSSTTSPAQTGLPSGFTSKGCWIDGANGRILNYQMPDSNTNTPETCVRACANAGYTIGAVEYGTQCFCDNFVYNGGVVAPNQDDCSFQCPGNAAEKCGAGGRMNLYSIGEPNVYQPPAAMTLGLPSNWKYSGCLEDNIPAKEDENEILSTFPYMILDEKNNTVPNCIAKCELYGYNAAALSYGTECFCGDTENIYVASAPSAAGGYTRSRIPQIVDDAQCNTPCVGDPQHLCGAGNRLSWYSYNGTKPLYSWGFPTGATAGKYELLIGGVVVPLITSQVITGKVTFVEKAGTGEPNGTGAYELDLSQIDNFDAAWRTMTGFQTDVFCSAGLTLPDRGGRQLTVGGWAGASNYGIRMYWPDGSAGVKGKNQWVEDPQNLQLQVPRWYPSALVLANGSVAVIGGEIGQNDKVQPTMELLPPTGVKTTTTSSGYSNTTVYLDFLERTAPFNLYPFVTVVPSGIFMAYYNEARILDDKTFKTIKTLPPIPGAVNEPTGGRSYQLEGAMVTLPQYAPYTEPMTVLICGGSTPGGGYAIDNCVSTQPEAANPVWTIERMPSRRVMPCISALPDGTYLILNGAEHGVAGFGLAYDPNFNALLYDPTKPVNQRISVMANTTVARLYHSEAITLLDGRVMVSGSDPEDDGNDPNFWPEEYRVEVFSPPYLLSGLPRPTFTMTSKDWAYGKPYSFTVSSGSTASVRVSLLGSVVSTHGNSMGQRTLFPAVSCTGSTCTVTAPPDAHTCPPGWYQFFVLDGPTPSVGIFIRIGGDPAGLGDWPKLPTFTNPGTGPV